MAELDRGFDGILGDERPRQSGHERPHPLPDPVLVTVEPIIRTMNMPTVAAMASRFYPLARFES